MAGYLSHTVLMPCIGRKNKRCSEKITMLLPHHKICKLAYAADNDDWILYAEDLILKWSAQKTNEVSFRNTDEIIIAAFLLVDGLLPSSAIVAFSHTMLGAIKEAEDNKLHLSCLHVHPPKPGRKENREQTFIRFDEVRTLIQDGKTATEAYKVVAEKHYKSPDTIRREFERAQKQCDREQAIIAALMKKNSENKETGENER